MGRISGRPWGLPVAAYGENLMATHTPPKTDRWGRVGSMRLASLNPAAANRIAASAAATTDHTDRCQVSINVRDPQLRLT